MKRTASTLALALAALCAAGDTEVVALRAPGEPSRAVRGGRVAEVRVLSTVTDGTAALKGVSELWGEREEVRDVSTSNFLWTVAWSNGTEVVTNVTAEAPYPLPEGLVSASSNWVVEARAETNRAPCAVLSVTNALSGQITCSGGYGSAAPEGKRAAPGDLLLYEGTARGRVTVILER